MVWTKLIKHIMRLSDVEVLDQNPSFIEERHQHYLEFLNANKISEYFTEDTDTERTYIVYGLDEEVAIESNNFRQYLNDKYSFISRTEIIDI